MNPNEALPLAERHQMVKQLLGSFRVDPCRREDFVQEAHLHIAHAAARCVEDPAKGCVRAYAYRIAYIQMGRWLMFEASPLAGGRNGGQRKKILAETQIVQGDRPIGYSDGDRQVTLFDLLTYPENHAWWAQDPERLAARAQEQRAARAALRKLAARSRRGGRLRAALRHLLAMDNPLGPKLAMTPRKPVEKLRREMSQLRYEIRMNPELAALTRAT